MRKRNIFLSINQIIKKITGFWNKFLTIELEGYFQYSFVVLGSIEHSPIDFTEHNYVNSASCLQSDTLLMYLGITFKLFLSVYIQRRTHNCYDIRDICLRSS